ncbi:MAG: restriction endonuclease subunit S [Clostridia bacterium]|nr:restriction endonuclease subunit S [Clostridia bacterium]
MKFTKLSDIASLTVGFVGTMAQHYVDSGVPFLRSLNIKPFYIDSTDLKYISASFSEILSKSILHENDIVIVRTGIPGTCCVVPKEYDGCNCADVVIVHPDFSKVNPYYLAAYINVWGQKQILNNKVGAIQQHFNVHTAEEMLVFLPDKETQDRVANLICSVNEKIQVNERLCTELEAMAKTLYDYWFVQFDFPDENGKPYRTSGGAMEKCKELGREVPKGWKPYKISELLAPIPNTVRIQTGEYKKEGAVPIIDQSASFIAGYTNEESALLFSDSGYIVFGDHTRIVKFIRFPFARGADGTQIIDSNSPCMPNELFYQAIRSINLSNQGYARHYKFLKDTMVIVPKETIAKLYQKIVSPLYEKISKIVFENVELEKLRDWLLPMLMNGQVIAKQ